MDIHQILTSTYLDLVFDGRNKAYGSYNLRRTYAQRMRLASLVLLFIALCAAGYKVTAERAGPASVLPLPEISTRLSDVDITLPKPEPKIELPEQPAAAAVKTEQFVLPDVIDDDLVREDQKPATQEDLKDAVAGRLTLDGDSSGIASPDIVDPNGKGTGGKEIEKPQRPGGHEDIPFVVDQQPEFPGGDAMLAQYLSRNISYPQAASNASQQGNVRVKFVVNEDGSISNVTVVRGFGYGSEQEAIRVVNSMPRWKPGKNNGVPVKVWFQLPVRFVLND